MDLEEPVSKRRIWITPGGRIEQGEDAMRCLQRELVEETGLDGIDIGPPIWTRKHTFQWNGNTIDQHERYYLVKSAAFEPTMDGNPATGERLAFRAFRWWSVDEIKASPDLFAPRSLGELLEKVIRHGPPERPLDVGV